jgi:hypothetical protein
MFYQHIWKAGGTMFTYMAEVNNGERKFHVAAEDGDNYRDQMGCGTTFLEHAAPLRTRPGVGFVPGPTPDSQPWKFVVLVRHPGWQPLSLYFNHHTDRTERAFLAYIHAPQRGITNDRSHHIDNIHTRWVGGTPRFGSTWTQPPITEGMFSDAVAMLRRFDHVFILEQFDRVHCSYESNESAAAPALPCVPPRRPTCHNTILFRPASTCAPPCDLIVQDLTADC